MSKKIDLSKRAIYGIASTIAEHLTKEEHDTLFSEDAASHFDYSVVSFSMGTADRMPCPSCPEGELGEPSELEFTASMFYLDIDLEELPSKVFDEITEAIHADFF